MVKQFNYAQFWLYKDYMEKLNNKTVNYSKIFEKISDINDFFGICRFVLWNDLLDFNKNDIF